MKMKRKQNSCFGVKHQALHQGVKDIGYRYHNEELIAQSTALTEPVSVIPQGQRSIDIYCETRFLWIKYCPVWFNGEHTRNVTDF